MKLGFLKKNTLILVLVATALFAFYGWLFYIVKEKNIKLSQASVNLETEQKQGASTQSIEKIFDESQEEIDLVEAYFVEKGSIVDFIEYLEGLGVRSGVEFRIQSVDETGDNKTYPNKENLSFKVLAQGDWSAVFTFLSALENVPYRIHITSVDLKKGGGDIKLSSGVLPISGQASPVVSKNTWRGDFSFEVLTFK